MHDLSDNPSGIIPPMPVAARSKAWISAAARLRGLRVRIPQGAWMSVSCECCMLSGRGLCVGLITRPEEYYGVWCVWVWLWSLNSKEALARWGAVAPTIKKKLLVRWRWQSFVPPSDRQSTVRDWQSLCTRIAVHCEVKGRLTWRLITPVCPWAAVSDWTRCQIFTHFGTEIIY
jgi:hypothetical protein